MNAGTDSTHIGTGSNGKVSISSTHTETKSNDEALVNTETEVDHQEKEEQSSELNGESWWEASLHLREAVILTKKSPVFNPNEIY